jgi:hypothetical protein
MGAGSKLISGALRRLVEQVTEADDVVGPIGVFGNREFNEIPASRRLNLQKETQGVGDNTKLYFGRLIENPEWKKVEAKLDEASQQNQYDMDPDYYDEMGIKPEEIIPMSDNKDQALGEAYFHYKSDGKFSELVSSDFLPSVIDDLESLRGSLKVDNKTFASLLEDSGYGPATNVYSTLSELEGWGLDSSIFD